MERLHAAGRPKFTHLLAHSVRISFVGISPLILMSNQISRPLADVFDPHANLGVARAPQKPRSRLAHNNHPLGAWTGTSEHSAIGIFATAALQLLKPSTDLSSYLLNCLGLDCYSPNNKVVNICAPTANKTATLLQHLVSPTPSDLQLNSSPATTTLVWLAARSRLQSTFGPQAFALGRPLQLFSYPQPPMAQFAWQGFPERKFPAL
ncbi:hypothetical protein IF1G_07034 [Cordyceps javanica]|uniref:Uncharacterized protein n=1 Tax=Cordyceps javanica TaxID=43265 RepID=A0A545UXF2_9HYPO|nr:hypothetical protein IF1G_07034 [Cordyceps javanica]TQW06031.1 hypothetical protein IF2G_06314 [Cordyceps javanica]